jgi:2-oxoglutarate ferredoxin oxidoreductase subunit delta
MVNIVIDEGYCKGCCLCIHYCPKKVLDRSGNINQKGYSVPYVVTPERCTKCKICELICPELAVTVEEDGA